MPLEMLPLKMGLNGLLVAFIIFIMLTPVLSGSQIVKGNSDSGTNPNREALGSYSPLILYGGGILYSPVNATYRTNTLPLNLSFSLAMGLQASLTYEVDGIYKGGIPLTPVETNETHIFHPLTSFIELPQLSEGSHCLTITVVAGLSGYFGVNPPGAPFKATGTSGNYEATWVNKIYFTVDGSDNPMEAVLPAITYLSIQNETYNTTQLPLNFNFNENYTLATYSLDDQRSIPLAKNAVLWNLSYGTHTLKLNVTDCSGNSATSQTSFTIENPAAIQVQPQKHFPTIFIIIASAISAVSVLTFAVYLKKRSARMIASANRNHDEPA